MYKIIFQKIVTHGNTVVGIASFLSDFIINLLSVSGHIRNLFLMKFFSVHKGNTFSDNVLLYLVKLASETIVIKSDMSFRKSAICSLIYKEIYLNL